MSTASSTRIVLLPDDSALLELLARTEQLLELITASEQDTANDPEEPRPWRLPDPLADGLATSALSRIASAIHAHLTPPGIPT
jgi:hypothetical protein